MDMKEVSAILSKFEHKVFILPKHRIAFRVARIATERFDGKKPMLIGWDVKRSLNALIVHIDYLRTSTIVSNADRNF